MQVASTSTYPMENISPAPPATPVHNGLTVATQPTPGCDDGAGPYTFPATAPAYTQQHSSQCTTPYPFAPPYPNFQGYHGGYHEAQHPPEMSAVYSQLAGQGLFPPEQRPPLQSPYQAPSSLYGLLQSASQPHPSLYGLIQPSSLPHPSLYELQPLAVRAAAPVAAATLRCHELQPPSQPPPSLHELQPPSQPPPSLHELQPPSQPPPSLHELQPPSQGSEESEHSANDDHTEEREEETAPALTGEHTPAAVGKVTPKRASTTLDPSPSDPALQKVHFLSTSFPQ